jgi:hypothetical protein
VKVRPVDTGTLTGSPYDRFYEGAVSAITDRNYAQALEYLQEARARTPRSVKVLNALGVVYDKLGRFDLSARYYAQARDIEPDSRIVAENLGYSLVLQGLKKPEIKVAATSQPALNVSMPPAQGVPVELAKRPPAAAPTQTVTKVALNEMPTVQISKARVPAQIKAFPIFARPPSVKAFAKLLPAPLPEPVPVKFAVSIPAKTQSPVKTTLLQPSPSIASYPTKPAATHGTVKQALTNVSVQAPINTAAPNSVKQASRFAPANQPPRIIIAAQTAKPRVLTIGQPLQVVNASGKADRGMVVSLRLKALGWTVKPSDLKQIRPESALLHSPANLGAAQALQRTLPFPVRLVRSTGPAMQLVVGRDYLAWKPRNAHLAALWQRGTVVASLQKPSTRGIR